MMLRDHLNVIRITIYFFVEDDTGFPNPESQPRVTASSANSSVDFQFFRLQLIRFIVCLASKRVWYNFSGAVNRRVNLI